jgi:hypothetical protein
MMKEGLSLEELRSRLEARARTEDLREPWLRAAAVWMQFDLKHLAPVSGNAAANNPLTALGADCVPLRTSAGTLWTLRLEPRLAALAALYEAGALQEALETNAHEERRPVNELFARVLRGEPPAAEEVDVSVLGAYREIARLLTRVPNLPAASRPPIDAIERRRSSGRSACSPTASSAARRSSARCAPTWTRSRPRACSRWRSGS